MLVEVLPAKPQSVGGASQGTMVLVAAIDSAEAFLGCSPQLAGRALPPLERPLERRRGGGRTMRAVRATCYRL